MKKVVRIILAILMVMCMALSITACKSECDKGNHAWDQGTVTKAATCSETGIKTYKCTECDHGEKSETIPTDSSKHTPISNDVAADCTHAGTTGATKCKDCNAVISAGTAVPSKGHDYKGQPWKTDGNKHYQECKNSCGTRNEHVIGVGSYEEKDGQHVQICTAEGCNTITANHTPDMGEFEVKGGRHISTCNVQGCNVAQGHDYAFGAWTEAGGKHVHTCTAQGCAIQEEHSAKFGSFVTTDADNHYKVCQNCDIKAELGAHDHDRLTKVSDSEHSVACSVCGHSFGNVAHNWILNEEKSVGSTCTVEGKNVYDCVCGAAKTERLPMLKHTMVWESNETTHTFKCDVCGHISVDSQVHGDDVIWNNTNTSEHWKHCKTCGYVFEDTRAPHDYKDSFTCKDCDRTPEGVIVATFYKGEAKRFDTLAEAVQSITDNSEAIIYLGQSLEGAGIFIPSNRNINFRLQGNTYTVVSGAVGSVKYESQAFHIEKDSNITIQNGTITSKAGSGVKMLVQNYANLTLMNNLVLDGTNLDADGTNPVYTLSNNFGATTIRNTTILVSENNGVAFDVWYGMKSAYLDGVSVTLLEGNNIRGIIEYGSAVKNTDWSKVSLVMQTDRNRAIRFSSDLTCDQANIKYADGRNVLEHMLSETWSYADKHHFHECTRCHSHSDVTECSETAVVTAKEPTCTEAGTTAGVQCSVCKTVIEQPEVIPASGHVKGTEYIVTDSGHALKCTVCSQAAEKEATHFYDNSICECGREIPVANIYALLHSLANGESNANGTFKLVGKVTEIDAKYKNNITISVTEGSESFSFYCYFVGDTDEFKTEIICVGDTVTLTDCVLKNYNGTYEIDRGSKFSGYKGADCEINYETSDNYTIDGLSAKVERWTEVTFTVTAKEGYRIDSVKANGIVLSKGADNRYSLIVTEKTAITVETVDANAPVKHRVNSELTLTPENIPITNQYKDVENTQELTLNGIAITFGWKNLYKDAGMQFNGSKNSGDSSLYNKTAIIGLKTISLNNIISGTGTLTVTVATDSAFTNAETLTSVNGVYTVPEGYTFFKIAETSGKAKKIASITIVCEAYCSMESTSHHTANDETCTTAGNIEYWECDTCHKYFADEKLVTEITDKDSVVIAPVHKIGELVDAVEPNCATETNGTVAHYKCSVCRKYFEDAEATKEITDISVSYKHTLTKVDRVAPTPTTEGKQEYWKCSVVGCTACFEDEQGATKIADIAIWGIIPATGDCAHDGDFAWKFDGVVHSKVCAECEGEFDVCDGMFENELMVTATSKNNGKHDFECLVCNNSFTDIDCDYNDQGVCTVCGYHKYSEVTVNVSNDTGLTVAVNIGGKQNVENGTSISLEKGVAAAIEVIGEGITYEITVGGTKLDGNSFTPDADTHTLTITVSKKTEEVTVTQTSFTAVSGKLNNDANVSYTSAKGGGTTAPAVNGGEIRLYQNSSGTGGGTITISIANGHKIKSLTIGSSMGTSIAYTIGSSTTKSNAQSLAANGTVVLTFEEDVTSITIHCMGKDKNSRLYVNYLSVTYA